MTASEMTVVVSKYVSNPIETPAPLPAYAPASLGSVRQLSFSDLATIESRLSEVMQKYLSRDCVGVVLEYMEKGWYLEACVKLQVFDFGNDPVDPGLARVILQRLPTSLSRLNPPVNYRPCKQRLARFSALQTMRFAIPIGFSRREFPIGATSLEYSGEDQFDATVWRYEAGWAIPEEGLKFTDTLIRNPSVSELSFFDTATWFIGSENDKMIYLAQMPYLTRLSFWHCEIQVEHLVTLAKCPKLTHLTIINNCCRSISHNSNLYVKFPCLKTVTLSTNMSGEYDFGKRENPSDAFEFRPWDISDPF